MIVQRKCCTAAGLGDETACLGDEASEMKVDVTFSSEVEEPTLHELENKAAIGSWKQIRRLVLSTLTETEGLPKDQRCQCNEEVVLRCVRCGPRGYFCENCFLAQHLHLNTFHVAEKWEVSCIEIDLSGGYRILERGVPVGAKWLI